MKKIWCDQSKYQTWLEVEQQIVYAWNHLNVIPTEDLKKINNLCVNLERMHEIEIITKHDVVAFIKMLQEQIITHEKKWIHLGITSSDVVDSAQNILIKKANTIIEQDLNNLCDILKTLILKYQDLLIMGRSHGMYGEPVQLGLKFGLWYAEIKRHLKRFLLAREQIEIIKISGSMGNYAALDPEIEIYVAKKFNMQIDLISTQICQRDRHAFLILVFANLASTLEKIATEIRLFQRSDVNEMAEGFSDQQIGSSSMPHKKNPIGSENICGLVRFIKSFSNVALENNVLWHERDISHSSNERIMFPDIYHGLSFVIKRLKNLLKNLYVNEKQIKKHINEAKNIFFGQKILTYILINNSKIDRNQVYDFLQKNAFIAQKTNVDFKSILIKNNIYQFISATEFEKIFTLNEFKKHGHKIIARILKDD